MCLAEAADGRVIEASNVVDGLIRRGAAEGAYRHIGVQRASVAKDIDYVAAGS